MNRDSIDSVVRALRRVNLQGSFFGQTVAIRFGLSESDIEALEVLIDTGAATAGRLSELMGLTTGAVTRVIDRLEQAGYVRRVPDPADRRRVIVEVVPGEDGRRSRRRWPASARRARPRSAATRDAELAVINDFLTRMADLTRDEANALRDAPGTRRAGGPSEYAAPIGGLSRARLSFRSGANELLLRGSADVRRPLPRQVRRRSPAGPPARRRRVDPVQGPIPVGLAQAARPTSASTRRPVGRRDRRRVEQAPGQARVGRPPIVRADRRRRPAPTRRSAGRPAMVPISLVGGASNAGSSGRRRARPAEAVGRQRVASSSTARSWAATGGHNILETTGAAEATRPLRDRGHRRRESDHGRRGRRLTATPVSAGRRRSARSSRPLT